MVSRERRQSGFGDTTAPPTSPFAIIDSSEFLHKYVFSGLESEQYAATNHQDHQHRNRLIVMQVNYRLNPQQLQMPIAEPLEYDVDVDEMEQKEAVFLATCAEERKERAFQRVEHGDPKWEDDCCRSHCCQCNVQFGILLRKHHCRACGKIFCYRHVANQLPKVKISQDGEILLGEDHVQLCVGCDLLYDYFYY